VPHRCDHHLVATCPFGLEERNVGSAGQGLPRGLGGIDDGTSGADVDPQGLPIGTGHRTRLQTAADLLGQPDNLGEATVIEDRC
jgi:hypothetical protein